MKPAIQPNMVVVLSGSGISAESGLPTFRDSNGLWQSHDWRMLASPEGWREHPELVLDFYNERRANAADAQPNAAHIALAELERTHEVAIITQNVDDLHERAGSTNVIHLHGQLTWARGTSPRRLRHCIGAEPIRIGDLCEDGSQLRPDIVWFGEDVENMDAAKRLVRSAGKVLVVGTSLTVHPAASLAKHARWHAEKVLCALDVDSVPFGYALMRGMATRIVPGLVRHWMETASV